MQIVKEYKLYTHPRGSHNKRDCLLVHEEFMYIHDNMMDAVKDVYKDYLNDSDDPIINYIITVVYEDGSEEVSQWGYIKPYGYYRYLNLFIKHNAPTKNVIIRNKLFESIINKEKTITDVAKLRHKTRLTIYKELKAYKKLMGYNKEEG